MTANGVVSWIEYVASLAALYACPTAIAVVRRARNIKRVLILNCIPDRLASRASHGVHDAAQG